MGQALGNFSGTTTSNRLRLEIQQASQSIANNQSVINYQLFAERTGGSGSWSLDLRGSSSVTINGSAIGGPAWNYDFRNSSTTPRLIMQGSHTVGHNSDGTLTINFSGTANSGSGIGSATTNNPTFTLTTIPRTSNVTLSTGTFAAGTAVTIFTNRASSTFTHTATFGFGNAGGTIATGVADSVSWTPPESLLQQITQSTSGVGTITLSTFSGGTFIGSSAVNFTLTAGGSVVPTFSAVTATENVALVSTEVGAFVQTLTRLNVSIVGAAGAQGSTISAATITVAGQTISALSGLTDPIGTSGTVSVVGTITDSRGRTATRTLNITVLPYIPPTLNPSLTVARRSNSVGVLNDEGTSIRVDINAVVQSLIVSTQRNALTYRVSTRVRGAAVFTIQTTATPGGIAFNNFVVVNTFAVSSSFEVLVEAFDKFNSGALQFTVATSAVFMHWGVGLGVGKFYEPNRGSIDAAGPIFQNNGHPVEPAGNVVMTARATAPVGWLLCEGQAVERVLFAVLFAAIGTQYGGGNGSTTFNVPDMRGRVPTGRNAAQGEFSLLGGAAGAISHNHSGPNHSHSGPNHTHRQWSSMGMNSGHPRGINPNRLQGLGSYAFHTIISETQSNNLSNGGGVELYIATTEAAGTGETGAAGTGATSTSSNLMPYRTLNFIIKT